MHAMLYLTLYVCGTILDIKVMLPSDPTVTWTKYECMNMSYDSTMHHHFTIRNFHLVKQCFIHISLYNSTITHYISYNHLQVKHAIIHQFTKSIYFQYSHKLSFMLTCILIIPTCYL